MKRDNAFTGLEAAIVLIAFVVVAAVFSYVLLGAGFFATQKAQEVTYAGIKQSVSNVVLDGSMYADTAANGNLTGVMFNVRVPLGGEPIDMSTTTFIFASSRQNTPILLTSIVGTETNRAGTFVYPTGPYEIEGFYPTANNPVLTSGEFATYLLKIGPEDTHGLAAKDWFTLEMRPRIGAATLVTKTLGSGVITGEVL